jgi:hypothetical protein
MAFTVSVSCGDEHYQKRVKITDPDQYGQLVFKEVKAALDWGLQRVK